jgi:hypothetical protein
LLNIAFFLLNIATFSDEITLKVITSPAKTYKMNMDTVTGKPLSLLKGRIINGHGTAENVRKRALSPAV